MKVGMAGRCLLVVVAMIMASPSWAGSVTGVVRRLLVRDSDGLVLVEIIGSATGKPACATHSYWIIRDENSESGKRQYALLLAAKASGLTVQISGANRCSRWSDGEDIDLVYAAE